MYISQRGLLDNFNLPKFCSYVTQRGLLDEFNQQKFCGVLWEMVVSVLPGGNDPGASALQSASKPACVCVCACACVSE